MRRLRPERRRRSLDVRGSSRPFIDRCRVSSEAPDRIGSWPARFGIGRGSCSVAAVGLARHMIRQAAMAEAGGLMPLADKDAELVHHG